MIILVSILVLYATIGRVQSQKGHYIRPLVESAFPAAITYGLPVYEEVPVVPRLYPGLYQTSPHQRQMKINRAADGLPPNMPVSSTQHAPIPATAAPRNSQESPQQPHVEVDHEDSPQISPYPILSYSNQMGNEGDYSYKFETADGMSKEESSVMTTLEDGKTARSVRGSYSYPTADGRMIRVNYVADEGGFRATTVTEGNNEDAVASVHGPGTTYRRVGERGFVYTYRAP